MAVFSFFAWAAVFFAWTVGCVALWIWLRRAFALHKLHSAGGSRGPLDTDEVALASWKGAAVAMGVWQAGLLVAWLCR